MRAVGTRGTIRHGFGATRHVLVRIAPGLGLDANAAARYRCRKSALTPPRRRMAADEQRTWNRVVTPPPVERVGCGSSAGRSCRPCHLPLEGLAMGRTTSKFLVAPLVLPIAFAFLAQSALAQEVRTVTVRVTDAATRQPVPSAQVSLVGTTTGGITNAEGRVILRGINPGTHEFRVLRVGYGEQKKAAIIAASGESTVEFVLQPTSIQLAPVVTTATGEQRRVEIGNAVSTIDVAKKIEESPIRSMGDILVAKAPGVQVLPGNMTGASSRVRVRGTSSISLSNDPIYVIDGIRMTNNANNAAGGAGVGGTTHSRVSDINPEEIENIEIVKGP